LGGIDSKDEKVPLKEDSVMKALWNSLAVKWKHLGMEPYQRWYVSPSRLQGGFGIVLKTYEEQPRRRKRKSCDEEEREIIHSRDMA